MTFSQFEVRARAEFVKKKKIQAKLASLAGLNDLSGFLPHILRHVVVKTTK